MSKENNNTENLNNTVQEALQKLANAVSATDTSEAEVTEDFDEEVAEELEAEFDEDSAEDLDEDFDEEFEEDSEVDSEDDFDEDFDEDFEEEIEEQLEKEVSVKDNTESEAKPAEKETEENEDLADFDDEDAPDSSEGSRVKNAFNKVKAAVSFGTSDAVLDEILQEEKQTGRKKKKKKLPSMGQVLSAVPRREPEDEEIDEEAEEEARQERKRRRRRRRKQIRAVFEKIKDAFRAIPPKVITYAAIILAVLLVGIVAITVTTRWKYHSYRVVNSRKQEDTMSAQYCNVEENILRYGTDGASLSDRNGNVLWDASYSMQTPAVVSCGKVSAIYDKSGSEVVVLGRKGQMGKVSTKLPIVKAAVTSDGNVAVIGQDAGNAYIDYYTVNGSQIAEIKTSMDNPGYPMDVSVSRNGELVAVTYLSFKDGTQKAIVRIYSFGSAGQNQMDNRIADFEYNDKIIPDVEYLSGSTLLAFRDDGFTVFSGSKRPSEDKTVTVAGEIASVFHDDSHVGLITGGDNGESFHMHIYTLTGKEILDQEFNFAYQTLDFVDDEVTLYNGEQFLVFNINGITKFDGSYNGSLSDIFALGRHRYVVVKENSLDMIQLTK